MRSLSLLVPGGRFGNGSDILRGGPGSDVFDFNSVNESRVGAARDRITDFAPGSDLIDLADIDAISGGGDDAFSFIGAAGFSGTAGELRALTLATATRILGDVNGDAVADFEILLTDPLILSAGDFIL